MLSNLIFVGIMCCIIFLNNFPVNGQLTDDEIENCKKQSTYSITNQQSLTLDLYYDALKNMEPDAGYLKAMCKGTENFTNVVSFNFHVGLSVTGDKNKIECIYMDNKEADCTEAIEQACASKLVKNFAEFVCCVNGKTGGQCVKDQDENQLENFNRCVKMDGSSRISPANILLYNANKGQHVALDTPCVPKLLFNGIDDQCARYVFYDDPIKVICAMLAEGREKVCPQKK